MQLKYKNSERLKGKGWKLCARQKPQEEGAGPVAKWLKFCGLCFSSPGSQVQTPGCGPAPLISHAVEASHIQKIEEEWHRCELRVNLLQVKKRRQQMLVQDESSSHTHTQILPFIYKLLRFLTLGEVVSSIIRKSFPYMLCWFFLK